MAQKMKFWNIIGKFKILDVKIGVVLIETAEEVGRPLAGNIVGNYDMLDGDIFQDGSEDVVCVYIAI